MHYWKRTQTPKKKINCFTWEEWMWSSFSAESLPQTMIFKQEEEEEEEEDLPIFCECVSF